MMSAIGQRSTSTAREGHILGWVAFAVGAAFLGLAALLIGGETLADPGGWRGVALTLAWLVPLLALAALAALRPAAALVVLGVLTLVPVGLAVWAVVDPEPMRALEERMGPVTLVVLVVVAAGLVVLGLTRPRAAGILLLVASVVPATLSLVRIEGQSIGLGATVVIAAPLVVTGVLFLLDARGHSPALHRQARPSTAV